MAPVSGRYDVYHQMFIPKAMERMLKTAPAAATIMADLVADGARAMLLGVYDEQWTAGRPSSTCARVQTLTSFDG